MQKSLNGTGYHRALTVLSMAVLCLVLIGCPQMLPPRTVDDVDVERFTGLWYQIARYYNPAEGELSAVTAEYTLNDDGTVKVVNRGLVGGLDGTPVSIEGFARVVDPEESTGKLAVTFTDPPVQREFEFWIIELAEDYSLAVISNSERSTLYIISRTPNLDETTYQELVERLVIRGFNRDEIIRTPQFDPDAPPRTVDDVDVERFTGLWYQIARYYNPAEGELSAVTAEYTLNDDGTVKVVNRGLVGGLDGTPVSIEGFARVVDPEESTGKLAVTFTDPPVQREFEFWIIELGDYYSYAVVSNSARSTLYIISRTPTLEESLYQDVIYRLSLNGFDPESIILTPQVEEVPPPETVAFVDIERYVGLWYEIARYPTPFDEDGVATTAEYTLNEDGTVNLVNRSLVGDLDGPPTSIEGVARVVDPATNAKLEVTFNRPDLEGSAFAYWIIELDQEYQYAVVTNDTRFVLYILSRTLTMEESIYEDLLYRVVRQGFDADRLERTPQLEE